MTVVIVIVVVVVVVAVHTDVAAVDSPAAITRLADVVRLRMGAAGTACATAGIVLLGDDCAGDNVDSR